MLGLDYSAGRPSGAAIRAAGYGFVVRYLDNGLDSGRVNINAAEFADLRAAGVAVALVWESQAERAAQGRAAGEADAAAALAAASAIGASGWPIYFAVDFDLPDYGPASADARAKLGPVGAYLLACQNTVLPWRMGVYGGYWAVSRALDAGLTRYAWQTAAWSGGHVDGRIHLFQRIGTVTVAGTACDVNEQHQDQFGQGAAVAPAPTKKRRDIVFEFVCNDQAFTGDPKDASTDNPDVLMLLGAGYAEPARWADVRAKDAGYGGDGTGSVLGIEPDAYGRYVALDAAVRARDAATGTGSGGGAPAVPVEYDLTLTGTATPKEA